MSLRTALASLLAAAALLPAVASASCEATLASSADIVSARAGALSGAEVDALTTACGPRGPAMLVEDMVDAGRCDEAAQLGRTLAGHPGVAAGVEAADACLAASVEEAMDRLASRASSQPFAPTDRSEDQQFAANEPMLDAPTAYGGLGGGAMSGAERRERGAATATSRDSDPGGYGYGPAAPRGRSGLVADLDDSDAYEGEEASPRASTGMGRMSPGMRSRYEGVPVATEQLGLKVWFDYDSAALRPEALETIARLSRQLSGLPSNATVEIVGHTDSTGSAWYNQQLSERRARSVERALRLTGTAGRPLAIYGAGEHQPVASNATSWGRARNRRVEFRFYQPMLIAR